MHVHGDETARQPAFSHRRFAGRLHALVDRQLQVVAGGRRLRNKPSVRSRLAERVNLDPGQARTPAQVTVIGVLYPFLTDFVARLQAPVARLLQLFLADLADRAEHVRAKASVRVGANEYPLYLDPREAVLVLLQVVDEVVADVLAQGHRRRRCQLQFLVHGAAHPGQGAVGECGQPRQLGVALADAGGQFAWVDLQGEAGPVGDQDLAVAVEDFAAGSAREEGTGAVVLGFGEVLFAVKDLQQPEAQEEDREEGDGNAAEDRQAHSEALVHRGAALI